MVQAIGLPVFCWCVFTQLSTVFCFCCISKLGWLEWFSDCLQIGSGHGFVELMLISVVHQLAPLLALCCEKKVYIDLVSYHYSLTPRCSISYTSVIYTVFMYQCVCACMFISLYSGLYICSRVSLVCFSTMSCVVSAQEIIKIKGFTHDYNGGLQGNSCVVIGNAGGQI